MDFDLVILTGLGVHCCDCDSTDPAGGQIVSLVDAEYPSRHCTEHDDAASSSVVHEPMLPFSGEDTWHAWHQHHTTDRAQRRRSKIKKRKIA